METYLCEHATGCRGAGDFRQWAKKQGYPFCEVFDWTSSAGDWTFIISKDGETWYLMTQANNFPRPGFTRLIARMEPMVGTAEEVLQYLADN